MLFSKQAEAERSSKYIELNNCKYVCVSRCVCKSGIKVALLKYFMMFCGHWTLICRWKRLLSSLTNLYLHFLDTERAQFLQTVHVCESICITAIWKPAVGVYVLLSVCGLNVFFIRTLRATTTIYVIWVNESVWGCLRPVILLSPLRTFPFSYVFYTNLFYWFSSRATFSLFPGSIAVFVAFLKVTPLKRSLTQGRCISFDLWLCFSTAGYISARLTSSLGATMAHWIANHIQFIVYLR